MPECSCDIVNKPSKECKVFNQHDTRVPGLTGQTLKCINWSAAGSAGICSSSGFISQTSLLRSLSDRHQTSGPAQHWWHLLSAVSQPCPTGVDLIGLYLLTLAHQLTPKRELLARICRMRTLHTWSVIKCSKALGSSQRACSAPQDASYVKVDLSAASHWRDCRATRLSLTLLRRTSTQVRVSIRLECQAPRQVKVSA